MPKTLNIAVIGAGTMAQSVHLPVLRRRWDRFAVAALVDHSTRRRREASEVWGIEEERRYESVADLVAAVRAKTLSLDGAVLSTDGLHVEDLLALMKRGIPVLAEPPLGFSAEEVAKVADFERMTGRRLVMMAYPQQYDDSVSRMSEHIAAKDLRMVDHEVLMPASQPLFGAAHVTTSSYDLPTEVRSQRRKALQAAVVAGAGDGATQRDRDLYVKGLLTGLAHQMAVTEAAYGAITKLVAVRHWPRGVIPGSIELLGELEGGAQVRLVWHYLPFAPEYSETVQVLSARRRMNVELPAPSHGDVRSTVSLREKKSGVVQETSTTAPKGAAELMWEAFHAFVEKGTPPVAGAAEARAQVELLREVLSSIVVSEGRSLEAAADEKQKDEEEKDEGQKDEEQKDEEQKPEGQDGEEQKPEGQDGEEQKPEEAQVDAGEEASASVRPPEVGQADAPEGSAASPAAGAAAQPASPAVTAEPSPPTGEEDVWNLEGSSSPAGPATDRAPGSDLADAGPADTADPVDPVDPAGAAGAADVVDPADAPADASTDGAADGPPESPEDSRG
ncbi:Gfo/Idh/MocA family oxidoreductase [Brachybacterium sp. AOP43-C2-M15]|uniref:Gfo/Idh/MocA family oxidoreductase n=1 Tax=Brachybacterium sp. AOP43-C2-M15 TaxID=3457661 RepID=UPI0040344D26